MDFDTSSRHILSRNSDVLSTEVDGEVAIMSIQKGRYYGLNPVASDIWRRLERPVEAGQLATQLIADYQGDPARIKAELAELLNHMLEQGIIKAVAPSQP